MSNEQLQLDVLSKFNDSNNMEIDNRNEENDDIDDIENIIYKNRLKELVNEIAKYDGFEGIQISKDGQQRIQQNSRYIISILVFEIVDQLRTTGRKQIRPDDVDKALDRILNKVSAIDNAILMLNEDIEKLEKIKNNSITNKVNKYINNI